MDLCAGGAVPEIMPPVTQTQGRTVPPVSVMSAKPHVLDVKGGDFVPRMTVVQSNVATAQHMSKPKRYSTQRQRPAADADMAGDMSYDVPSTGMTSVRPSATDHTYYGTRNLTAILEYVAEL